MFFLGYVELAGLTFTHASFLDPPTTRDCWKIVHAPLLFSAVRCNKMQEEHAQPHTHSEIEFAAENLIMDSNQRSQMGCD